MAELFYPFDAGAGANVAEGQWREMARHWLATGVLPNELDQLGVFGDSSGLQVKLRTGKAWVRGHFYLNDAQRTLPIGTADPTLPRIDRVVLRADFVANTITATVLQGSPAASPAVPPLTQTSGVWEVALAEIAVAAGASTITAGNVTDRRVFTRNLTAGLINSAFVRDAESTTASAYTNLLTVGPDVPFTVPSSGRVLLLWSVGVNVTSGNAAYASPTIVDATNGADVDVSVAANDDRSVVGSETLAAAPNRMGMVVYSGLLPDHTGYIARLKYRVNGGTGTFSFRRLVVIPL